MSKDPLWQREFLHVDLALASIPGAVATWTAFDSPETLPAFGQDELSVLFPLLFGLSGFGLTTFAIILGYEAHPNLRRLVENVHYPKVARTYMALCRSAALWAGLLLLAWAFPGVLPVAFVSVAVIQALGHSMVRAIRAIWILQNVTSIASQKKAEPAAFTRTYVSGPDDI